MNYFKYSMWQQLMFILQLLFSGCFAKNDTSNTYTSMFALINICQSSGIKTYVYVHIQLLQSNQDIYISRYIHIYQRWICMRNQSSIIQDVSFTALSLHLLNLCNVFHGKFYKWKPFLIISTWLHKAHNLSHKFIILHSVEVECKKTVNILKRKKVICINKWHFSCIQKL